MMLLAQSRKMYRYFVRNPLLRHYRVIVNSLLLIWLALGFGTVVSHSPPLGIMYAGLIVLHALAVVYADCRTCPLRFGKCTHFYLGRLSKFMPPAMPGKQTVGGRVLIGITWTSLLLLPQYWLWPNKVLLAIFWMLPVAIILIQRFEVCWKKCGNLDCALNKKTHPLPWEKRKSTWEKRKSTTQITVLTNSYRPRLGNAGERVRNSDTGRHGASTPGEVVREITSDG